MPAPLTWPPVPTVATDVLLLLQVPPDVASFKLSVALEHRLPVPIPVIATGDALTVTTVVVVQPDTPDATNMIVAVPPATADTVPSVPTVATALLLLLQAPGAPSVRDNVVFGQIAPVLPEIGVTLITFTEVTA